MSGLPEVPECAAQANYTRLPAAVKSDIARWCRDMVAARRSPHAVRIKNKTQQPPIRKRIRKFVTLLCPKIQPAWFSLNPSN